MVFSWGEAIWPWHLCFILLDAPHFKKMRSQCPLAGTGGHVAQGHVKSRSVFSNLRLTREKHSKINVNTPKIFTFCSVRWPNTEVHFHTESPVCLKLRGRTHTHGISECFFSSVAYADTTFQKPLTNCSNLKMKLPEMWCCISRTRSTRVVPFYIHSTSAEQELFTPNTHSKIKCCKIASVHCDSFNTYSRKGRWF